MKNQSYKAHFIVAVIFFLTSLLWFFWVKRIAIGIMWLCLAILNLVRALLVRRNEKQEEKEEQEKREEK